MSFFFYLLVSWLGICVEVHVDRITILPPPPLPSWSFFPTQNSFFNTSDSYLKSARASSWFRCRFSFIYWSPWEKFPGEHHVKLWDGTKLLRFAESASSNIVLYSRFIWLDGSITQSLKSQISAKHGKYLTCILVWDVNAVFTTISISEDSKESPKKASHVYFM